MGKCCRIFLAVTIFALPGSLFAFRSCGSATCPLNNYRSLHGGWLNLAFTHEYINQDEIYVGSSRSAIGAIPGDHDEVQTINERNDLSLQAGMSDALSVGVNVPFISRQHSHIGHENGNDVWESWNISGLGDIRMSASYALLLPSEPADPGIVVIGGIKFPTGVTRLRNDAGEQAEVPIQPGTGSTDGIVALNVRQGIASVPTLSGVYGEIPLIVGASYQFNGAGTDGYRSGNVFFAHLESMYQFASRASILLQFNGKFQGFADVGTTNEPRGNTGGTWVFVSPGLNVHLNDALEGTAYVQFPLYQNVHGIQQSARYNISMTLSYGLNLFEHE